MEHISNQDEDAALQALVEDHYLAELIRERLKPPIHEVPFDELLAELGLTQAELAETTVYVEEGPKGRADR